MTHLRPLRTFITSPIFSYDVVHYTADGRCLMGIWAGSRMYRGDDIYLLDFWPLDNLNTDDFRAGFPDP